MPLHLQISRSRPPLPPTSGQRGVKIEMGLRSRVIGECVKDSYNKSPLFKGGIPARFLLARNGSYSRVPYTVVSVFTSSLRNFNVVTARISTESCVYLHPKQK